MKNSEYVLRNGKPMYKVRLKNIIAYLDRYTDVLLKKVSAYSTIMRMYQLSSKETLSFYLLEEGEVLELKRHLFKIGRIDLCIKLIEYNV